MILQIYLTMILIIFINYCNVIKNIYKLKIHKMNLNGIKMLQKMKKKVNQVHNLKILKIHQNKVLNNLKNRLLQQLISLNLQLDKQNRKYRIIKLKKNKLNYNKKYNQKILIQVIISMDSYFNQHGGEQIKMQNNIYTNLLILFYKKIILKKKIQVNIEYHMLIVILSIAKHIQHI